MESKEQVKADVSTKSIVQKGPIQKLKINVVISVAKNIKLNTKIITEKCIKEQGKKAELHAEIAK